MASADARSFMTYGSHLLLSLLCLASVPLSNAIESVVIHVIFKVVPIEIIDYR